ncbi:hypothetical protein, partial [Pseudomonas laurylsulfatiphila]|uniref:hypothetical protein n=1 Tax=Pseudomonas laurylsulfatiphila TaxID=2011015 RepID=UPI003D0E0960
VGAAEGCDLLILIFSNLQIAKARSKDRPNAARAFGSSYKGTRAPPNNAHRQQAGSYSRGPL